jgi:hypothetical protein
MSDNNIRRYNTEDSIIDDNPINDMDRAEGYVEIHPNSKNEYDKVTLRTSRNTDPNPNSDLNRFSDDFGKSGENDEYNTTC